MYEENRAEVGNKAGVLYLVHIKAKTNTEALRVDKSV